MSQIVTKITPEDLQMLKELEKKSTQVVGWYANYGGQVRGPFCRWFEATEVAPEYEKNVGTREDDAKYCAAAMNYLPKLIERIEELETLLAVENMLRQND